MKRERHKRLYDLHSWIGILLGLFVFIVCATGTIAVFAPELTSWENPANRTPNPAGYKSGKPLDSIKFEPLFMSFLDEGRAKGRLDEDIRVGFPQETSPYYSVATHYTDAAGKEIDHDRTWNAVTGEVLPESAERASGLSLWLRLFHRWFMLPNTQLGIALVGVAGVFMLVSTITGILIHGKIIKEFFTLRLGRSQRLKWQDSHKVLGILGLPFSLMISYTGMYLGMIGLVAPVIALLAFHGDTDGLIKAVLGEDEHKASGEIVQMMSMDELYAMRHPNTKAAPRFTNIEYYGDKNSHYTVFFNADQGLTTNETLTISGATGKGIDSPDGVAALSPPVRIMFTYAPLHYARYGSVWLKWVYVFMGTCLSIMIATGLMMWVERRQYGGEGNKSDRFYDCINRINIGVCLAIPLASVAIFYLDKLYLGIESARLYWTGVTYFCTIAAVMVFALLRQNGHKTSKILIISGGLGLLGLPVLNAMTTGATLWSAQSVGEEMSNGVDISFVILGLISLITATQIPEKRNVARKGAVSLTATCL